MSRNKKDQVPFTRFQIGVLGLSILLWIGLFLYLFVKWPGVPQSVPTHYGAGGVADAWGDKGSFLMGPAIGFSLSALLIFLTFFPRMWNVPVRLTAENRVRVLSRARDLLCVMQVVLAANFVYLTLKTIQCAPLGFWFTPIILGSVFGSLAICIIRIVRSK